MSQLSDAINELKTELSAIADGRELRQQVVIDDVRILTSDSLSEIAPEILAQYSQNVLQSAWNIATVFEKVEPYSNNRFLGVKNLFFALILDSDISGFKNAQLIINSFNALSNQNCPFIADKDTYSVFQALEKFFTTCNTIPIIQSALSELNNSGIYPDIMLNDLRDRIQLYQTQNLIVADYKEAEKLEVELRSYVQSCDSLAIFNAANISQERIVKLLDGDVVGIALVNIVYSERRTDDSLNLLRVQLNHKLDLVSKNNKPIRLQRQQELLDIQEAVQSVFENSLDSIEVMVNSLTNQYNNLDLLLRADALSWDAILQLQTSVHEKAMNYKMHQEHGARIIIDFQNAAKNIEPEFARLMNEHTDHYSQLNAQQLLLQNRYNNEEANLNVNLDIGAFDLKIANAWNDQVVAKLQENIDPLTFPALVDTYLCITQTLQNNTKDADSLDVLKRTNDILEFHQINFTAKYFGSAAGQIGGKFGEYLSECKKTYAWHDFFITQCNYFFWPILKPQRTELEKRTALVTTLKNHLNTNHTLDSQTLNLLIALPSLKQHQSILTDFQTGMEEYQKVNIRLINSLRSQIDTEDDDGEDLYATV